jgi:hypothetical protein
MSDLISVTRTKAVPIALGAVLFVLDAGVASRRRLGKNLNAANARVKATLTTQPTDLT